MNFPVPHANFSQMTSLLIETREEHEIALEMIWCMLLEVFVLTSKLAALGHLVLLWFSGVTCLSRFTLLEGYMRSCAADNRFRQNKYVVGEER